MKLSMASADTLQTASVITSCSQCGQCSEDEFCCSSCRIAFNFLRSQNLKPGFVHSMTNPDSIHSLTLFETEHPEQLIAEFYIEGIHCVSCLPVLEKIADWQPNFTWTRLDLSTNVLTVSKKPHTSFVPLLQWCSRLGYQAKPLFSSDEEVQALKNQQRTNIKRLGIAGACALNVMLFSSALYTGAKSEYGDLFRWLTLILALPSLSYCAFPFYQNALRGLQSRKVSIDLPLSIALLVGFIFASASTLYHSNELYLDSLTSLVFLLLASRYWLQSLLQKEAASSKLYTLLLPVRARLAADHSYVSLRSLKKGTLIEVRSGETVPADCRLESESGEFDLSVLTGESETQFLGVGQPVQACSVNRGSTILLKVEQEADNGSIKTLLNQLQKQKLKPDSGSVHSSFADAPSTTDTYAKAFTFALGIGLLIIFIRSWESHTEILKRSLTLLVAACPCALSLAPQFVMARASRLAAQLGVFVRRPQVFEQLNRIKTIIFDKTGTLTQSRPQIISSRWNTRLDESQKCELLTLIQTAQKDSSHPYSKAIGDWSLKSASMNSSEYPQALSVTEVSGVGLFWHVGPDCFRLGRNIKRSPYNVVVQKNGIDLLELKVTDSARDDAAPTLSKLKKNGIQLEIISGDQHSSVSELASSLHIKSFQSRMMPEQKGAYLSQKTDALYVGDGLNDAYALSRAPVGIAVKGAIETALQAADGILAKDSLVPLIGFVKLFNRAHRILRINFAYALIYNLVSAYLAITGQMGPLTAALIMPLSAATVYLNTNILLRNEVRV